MITRHPGRTTRRGAAIVWVLVILAVVTAFSVTAVARFVSGRKQLDMVQHRIQAEWLARSGYELAIDRLLSKPETAIGETVTILPGGEVTFSVKNDPNRKGVYLVESEARYTAYPGVVVAGIRRTLKRDGNRIVTLSAEP